MADAMALSVQEAPQQRAQPRIMVVGAGKMGGILIEAFLAQRLVPAENIAATVLHPERVGRRLATGVVMAASNQAGVREAEVVLLCVKPQAVAQVLAEIRPEMTPGKLLISIAASVPTTLIEQCLGAECAVIRAMPNTPSMVGAGMTALARGRSASAAQMATAQSLFEAVGRAVEVEEKHMDAITGLSASGPAFMYIILEALAEGGVKMGLSRELATLLAAQMTYGAARMVLETGEHPARLKDTVTTPAGCTIDGILELEEGKLRVTLIKAVVKASQRAQELHLAGTPPETLDQGFARSN